ncbi:MAG: alpha/beta hydrolase [Micromonosporaceae bacterium]|nr:alpha/beta hydrolase [Micromonosporaceae bacterium]
MARRGELASAVLVAAASLTPSLLPKTAMVQGVVTGIAAVAGYALGSAARWMLGPVRQRIAESTRARLGWVLLGGATCWLVPAAWQGQVWQQELALSVGQTDPPPTNAVVALLIAAAMLVVAVAAARLMRVTTRWATRWLARLLPQWLAVTAAVAVVTAGTAVVTYQAVSNGLLAPTDQSFRLVDREASPNTPAPADPLRSGGPGSLVAWSTLGRAGREFVALPSPTGGQRPIRVYAGIDSAVDLGQRANLVVAELERTGGLSRPVVCVVIPTGTGWVDPTAVRALEAQWGGESAIASMQYSYLPSVLSLVIDRLRVDAAARALIGAVVRRWATLPAEGRPKLVLFGESLGSHGIEVAMHGVPQAESLVSGILLVGPPNSNPTWSRLVSQRDAGSPMLAPVVNGGRSVRFWAGPEMPRYDRTMDPWPEPISGPRLLYLQHPSDPIVWWSPSLLWSRPGWVAERTIVSRAPPLRWRPIVTFWQIMGDAVFSMEVPKGHGHRYGGEMSAAWAAVAPRTVL